MRIVGANNFDFQPEPTGEPGFVRRFGLPCWDHFESIETKRTDDVGNDVGIKLSIMLKHQNCDFVANIKIVYNMYLVSGSRLHVGGPFASTSGDVSFDTLH